MSGEDIPYQLRPNKFIDRQMFLDLLSRLVVPRGAEKYIYISMGGRHLIDHYAIYNRLGIDAQYSFDRNANEVARQKFNRPTGRTICAELDTANLPAELDAIQNKFSSRKNMIVWLDYTEANRRTQFQEAVQTLIRLKHGDVFRVTLNANPQTLCAGDEWQRAGAESPAEHRASKLRAQIEEYMPTSVTEIGEAELSSVLAECVELAAKAAEAQQHTLRITPVLVTSYRDGSRMLTVTCAVSESGKREHFPPAALSRWQFACKGWTDVQQIYAPVLSTREQNRLDAHLHRGPARMLGSLSFLPHETEAKSLESLKSYRKLHRYYPTFRNVDH